jgi:2-C-methyl-D-erythritol 4-phosphate cytidylyltransferase / 2-C-methyl-D-erythritol 2,4-cyclodiphosphate synthase
MNTALIVAAGTGSRSELKESKILFKINHKPIFMYSVELFQSLGFDICLVVSKSDMNEIMDYVDESVKIVIGGKTRSESVEKGLKEVTTPYVYIHDAARPLITRQAIIQIEKALEVHDAVVLAEPVVSALKFYDKNSLKTLDREQHILTQTPQAFLTEKIRYAYIRNQDAYDDDISLYQGFYPKQHIQVIFNEEPNPKLTYYHDFIQLKKLLEGEQNMRIGHSFDLHPLKEGRKLILGGIEIKHDKGLDGHSDADALCHVISEAMLGALALGDLGTHFPDTDDKYKDISSTILLQTVYQKIKKHGYIIGNIDATIYAQEPKINPYIHQIRENIAHILTIKYDDISVKATTYERMDSIGNEKAMAAEAVVLLRKVIL